MNLNESGKEDLLGTVLATWANNGIMTNSCTVPHGWCIPDVYQPWSSQTIRAYSTVAVDFAPVHHASFPIRGNAKAPCGDALAGDKALTGAHASADIDAITCLRCLRAMVKAK